MWLRKKKRAKPEAADAVGALRTRALTSAADTLGVALPTLPRVWGAIMEIGFPDAAATLVCFADGSTSLYFSSGGGMIGAGERPPVRAAAAEFLQAAERALSEFAPSNVAPLPAPGRVRFYLRTSDGLMTQEADEQELGRGRGPLAPLFHAGHAVIARLREVNEGEA